MNKEKYNQIIDEAYENYVQKCNEDKWMKEIVLDLPFPNKSYGLFTQEEFINKTKTDDGFSNTWGLKIEERDMTWEERVQWVMKYTDVELENLYIVEEAHKETSPTRISTIITDKERIAIYL